MSKKYSKLNEKQPKTLVSLLKTLNYSFLELKIYLKLLIKEFLERLIFLCYVRK
jgi:hypothetical protein